MNTMNTLISSLFSAKAIPIALISITAGSTIATTAAAGYKISQTYSRPDNSTSIELSKANQVMETENDSPSDEPSSKLFELANSNDSLNSLAKSSIVPSTTNTKPSPKKNTFPTATQPTNNQSNSQTIPDPNLCIVTLSGQQYDVTSLRSSHPGGDVFVCGSDQTALYQSQHGSNLSRMQKYLYNPNSGTSTGSSNTNTNANNNTNANSTQTNHEEDEHDIEHEDEHNEDGEEDEDHEDEYEEEDDEDHEEKERYYDED